MIKKILLTLFCLWIPGCMNLEYVHPECPWVTIPRDKAAMTQKVNYADEFRIELIGYEGFCYNDNAINRNTAYITPQFRIYRLRKSDESHVDFDFYTETLQGPPGYVGKRSYSASVDLELDEKTKDFNGPEVKVKLPPFEEDDFEILLGLDLSPSEYNYNRQFFSTSPVYEEGPTPRYIERTIVVDEEVTAKPRIKYIEAPDSNPPAKSGCKSCALKNLFGN